MHELHLPPAHVVVVLLVAALAGVVISHLWEVWAKARREAEANATLDSFCPPVPPDPSDTDLQAILRWFLLGPGQEVQSITLAEAIEAAGIPLDEQMPTHLEQARELLARLGWSVRVVKQGALTNARIDRVWYRPPHIPQPAPARLSSWG